MIPRRKSRNILRRPRHSATFPNTKPTRTGLKLRSVHCRDRHGSYTADNISYHARIYQSIRIVCKVFYIIQFGSFFTNAYKFCATGQ